jgi:hypothetical protein
LLKWRTRLFWYRAKEASDLFDLALVPFATEVTIDRDIGIALAQIDR